MIQHLECLETMEKSLLERDQLPSNFLDKLE